jgi:tetratricopeptide (TPR) repeat protein
MKLIITFLLSALFLLPTQSFTQDRRASRKNSAEAQQEVSAENKRRNARLFADGVRERITGNNQRAVTLFEQALEADPNDHASMYELAELYANEGNINKALKMMEKAVALEPSNSWYLVRIAQIYKYLGNYEAYANAFYKLVDMHPNNPEYYNELSSALILQGKFKEALQVYNQIEAQIGVNEILSLQKQSIYLTMDQPANAIAELKKLADAFPFEPRYLSMLARLYMTYGPSNKALEVFEKIKQFDPEDPFIHISLSEYYLAEGDKTKAFEELLMAFGNIYLDVDTKIQILLIWLRGSEEADELEDKTLKLVSMLVKTHPESSRAHHMMAEVYYRESDFELAQQSFINSVSIDSSVYVVWENLLFTDIQLLDFEMLESHSIRANLLFPEQPVPYYFAAVAKYQQGKYAEALRMAENGRRFVVGNDRLLGEFFAMIGDIQYKLGNTTASDQAYDRALVINPLNVTVLNNYAYYLSLRGEKLEKAEEMSRQAVEQSPDVSAYLDTYAWIMYKKGRYEEALVWIEKAMDSLTEDNGVILEHYGDILYKLGQKESALEYWKKAQEAGEASDFIDRKVAEGILYE